MWTRICIALMLVAGLACNQPHVDKSGGGKAAKPGTKGVWPGKLPFKVIYIARHGSTVMNRYSQIGGHIQYDPLDALGFKERVGVFLVLKDEPIKAVYTSMQRRSQMTAEPLVAHLKLKMRKTSALNEFAGGVSEGICYSLMGKNPQTAEAAACDQTSDDPLVKRAEAFLRAENKRRFKVGPSYRWPGGGESIFDVGKRLDGWLRSIPTDLQNETIALFGHSGTNRFLLAKLMGWKPIDAARVRQGHTQIFRVERKPGGKRELKVFLAGKWVLCDKPPTFRGGLPCMPRKRRSKAKPVKVEVHDKVVKDAKVGSKPVVKPGAMKPGGMKPAVVRPRAMNPKLGKKPYK